ncbi:MAG TPA: acyl-CoA carboxylase subunit beta [Candidatus Pacearchaeota archaeon]|nr:acyl-CoA carboxylase subunit beta [Candidatus Pacearchaeota archaeon]
MNFKKELARLSDQQDLLKDQKLVEKQHQKGKLGARERLDLLFDTGTFVELEAFVEDRLSLGKEKIPGDGVVTGFGKVNGRQVYAYSQDFSVMGGSLGEMHAKKIIRMILRARKTGCPIIGIIDSGGARIQEGVYSLDGYGGIFKEMIRASGVVPQITVLLGPSAGGASYSPGLSDFVFMVEKISLMFITGPDVVKKVNGEEINAEELGGTKLHNEKSGCAHFAFKSEAECFSSVKKLLSYLPSNNIEDPPHSRSLIDEVFEREELPELLEIVSEDDKKSYDVKEVIQQVADKLSFFEIQEEYAQNVVVGFARIAGHAVGIVANQPKILAGCLDINSSDKIARFVRFCDAFNIPLVNFVDTPGYLPGKDQESNGIIRHGAKVLYAYSEASVPKISIILRKAYGGAYIAMCSKLLAYDALLAWPGAQLAVMGPEQAVEIIFRKEALGVKDAKKFMAEKSAEMREKLLNPFLAAKAGQVDMVINPKDTRIYLIKILESLLNKREEKIPRKHGNIPL